MILPRSPAQGCRAGGAVEIQGLVIHRLLDRLPQCIDFGFPNLQERSKEKIKNTVSLKLNKNLAQGRYLGEQGVTAEVRTVDLFIALTLPWPGYPIISTMRQRGAKNVRLNCNFDMYNFVMQLERTHVSRVIHG